MIGAWNIASCRIGPHFSNTPLRQRVLSETSSRDAARHPRDHRTVANNEQKKGPQATLFKVDSG